MQWEGATAAAAATSAPTPGDTGDVGAPRWVASVTAQRSHDTYGDGGDGRAVGRGHSVRPPVRPQRSRGWRLSAATPEVRLNLRSRFGKGRQGERGGVVWGGCGGVARCNCRPPPYSAGTHSGGWGGNSASRVSSFASLGTVFGGAFAVGGAVGGVCGGGGGGAHGCACGCAGGGLFARGEAGGDAGGGVRICSCQCPFSGAGGLRAYCTVWPGHGAAPASLSSTGACRNPDCRALRDRAPQTRLSCHDSMRQAIGRHVLSLSARCARRLFRSPQDCLMLY